MTDNTSTTERVDDSEMRIHSLVLRYTTSGLQIDGLLTADEVRSIVTELHASGSAEIPSGGDTVITFRDHLRCIEVSPALPSPAAGGERLLKPDHPVRQSNEKLL